MRHVLRQAVQSMRLGDEVIERVLHFARAHLEMDTAWISHGTGRQQVVESLDGAGHALGVAVGSEPGFDLGAAVVNDVGALLDIAGGGPLGSDLRRAQAMGVGSYIGVALQVADGETYGMLCCLGHSPDPSLRERDAHFLGLSADLLVPSITERDAARHRIAAVGARIQAVLDAGGPRMVYQPIQALRNGAVVAYEALARFPSGHGTPEQWFADAAAAGLGRELELAAVRTGLGALSILPSEVSIAVNASADTAISPELARLIGQHDPRRVIVEITEHSLIGDYHSLRRATDELRSAGVRIAVDDAGAGYAGFQHLVELCPDIIKLDRQLTHQIDVDPARIAMASAISGFAHAVHATVLAEGIETACEQATVARLGISLGQGYRLGRPAPLAYQLARAN